VIFQVGKKLFALNNMHRHKYDVISTNEHRSYEFLSEGPKGTIKKIILFKEISDNFYNLGFGDWDEATKLMDDKARSNNHDRDKVLATVAAAVMTFIKYYPMQSFLPKEVHPPGPGFIKWEYLLTGKKSAFY
jgi:hypothetical protein